MRSEHCSILLALIVVLMIGGNADGQILYGQPTAGSLHFIYSSYTIDDSTGVSTDLTQSAIPLRGFIPLQDNFEAVVYLINSSNNLEEPDSKYDLSGMGDLRVQFNRSFSDVGVNLPTGKKKLTPEEGAVVLQALAQNYLSLPMRRFGEGFGASVLFGGARMVGDLRLGAGLMYQITGEYEPYEGGNKYDPGNVFSLNVGVDWEGERAKVSGDVIASLYSSDKFEGEEAFKQSSQINLRMKTRLDQRSSSFSGQVGYLIRGRNTNYLADNEELKIYGNEFYANGGMSWSLQGVWSVGPTAELKLIGENDAGFGSSTIFGFGGQVGRSLGEQIGAIVGFKYFTGSLDGGDLDMSGYQITAGLTASL